MTTTTKGFKNDHLSNSRLKLYEQCPKAFYFQYVDKGPKAPRGDAAAFGNVLHEALETTYREVIATEHAGPFPDYRLLCAYADAFQGSALTGVERYAEGVDLMQRYAKLHPTVDHMRILAVEQEFNVQVGEFKVNGFIDRVDKLGDDGIRIVDYKSNRLLYSKSELDHDLQFSIYALAARELYPWAKRVTFAFQMLRWDMAQTAERPKDVVDDVVQYILALGRRIESTEEKWGPKINANCGYCDHRERCDAYAEAIYTHPISVVETVQDVTLSRERLHVLAKLMYARKAELEELIKAKIQAEGPFESAGQEYSLQQTFTVSYPDKYAVAEAFSKVGVNLWAQVVRVDKDSVEELRLKCTETLERTEALQLKADLEALAERVLLQCKLQTKPVVKRKTAPA